MNKIMPQHFDANEWFLIFALSVMIVIVLLLPRRFPSCVTIVFLLLGWAIPMFVDFFLAHPAIDVYDVNDTSYYDLFDLALYYLYAPFSYVFVYLYDRWKVTGWWISLYVLGWAAISIAFEAFAIYCHVFKYKGWNLGYSFVFYLLAETAYLLLYYVIKRKYNQTKKATGHEWT